MILVTGANGYVGRHVVARLVPRGGIRAMVRRPSRYDAPGGVDVVGADLLEAGTLPAAVAGATTIVHAAAITANYREPYRGAYDRINRQGTENLVAAARDAGVKLIVLVSGMKTRPAPDGTYMATRWAMEEAVRDSGIAYAIVQPSVQFGEDAEFVAALARLIRQSPVVPAITGPHDKFQPIWVEDVVTCIERCIDDATLQGAAHEVGGSEYHTFGGIMRVVLEAMGKRRLVAPLPVSLARVPAFFMGVLPRPPLTKATLELFTAENATDLDAVDRTFGFHPRGLREHLLAHGISG